MVSTEMFEDFFLPGVIRECEAFEASIYHLDGLDALRYLDSLLDVPALNAIQWVWGTGNERASDWIDVFQRCQNAGKGVQITCELDELDAIIANLRPEGVWLRVIGVADEDEGESALRQISKWV
ncbi:MAG: hypothetical protein GXP32_02140 [Kiritimatiellaeota bacterium]|nr:hypothetical protein [Kiritimatiellota bacterium]